MEKIVRRDQIAWRVTHYWCKLGKPKRCFIWRRRSVSRGPTPGYQVLVGWGVHRLHQSWRFGYRLWCEVTSLLPSRRIDGGWNYRLRTSTFTAWMVIRTSILPPWGGIYVYCGHIIEFAIPPKQSLRMVSAVYLKTEDRSAHLSLYRLLGISYDRYCYLNTVEYWSIIDRIIDPMGRPSHLQTSWRIVRHTLFFLVAV